MNSILEAELCQNCRRSPPNHRPWCGRVQTAEPPKAGEIVEHAPMGRAELISVYTRAEAIEDGILVDCTQEPFDTLNRNVGLWFDVAVTRAVFERYIEVPERCQGSQDLKGRYWDIIWMFALSARRQRSETELLFEFVCVPNGPGLWCNEKQGPSPEQLLVQLKATSGPGDRGEPCLTFMLPSED